MENYSVKDIINKFNNFNIIMDDILSKFFEDCEEDMLADECFKSKKQYISFFQSINNEKNFEYIRDFYFENKNKIFNIESFRNSNNYLDGVKIQLASKLLNSKKISETHKINLRPVFIDIGSFYEKSMIISSSLVSVKEKETNEIKLYDKFLKSFYDLLFHVVVYDAKLSIINNELIDEDDREENFRVNENISSFKMASKKIGFNFTLTENKSQEEMLFKNIIGKAKNILNDVGMNVPDIDQDKEINLGAIGEILNKFGENENFKNIFKSAAQTFNNKEINDTNSLFDVIKNAMSNENNIDNAKSLVNDLSESIDSVDLNKK